MCSELVVKLLLRPETTRPEREIEGLSEISIMGSMKFVERMLFGGAIFAELPESFFDTRLVCVSESVALPLLTGFQARYVRFLTTRRFIWIVMGSHPLLLIYWNESLRRLRMKRLCFTIFSILWKLRIEFV